MKAFLKSKTFKFLYIILIVLFVSYIFSNSVESREVSASKSSNIVEKINTTLEKMNSPILLKEVFVRKTAHFVEFFILGTLLFGYVFISDKINITDAVYICFISCIIAMTDETIQFFSNRGSMLLDVWLDFFAASFAIFILYFIARTYIKKRT